jgi:hypothetical protein
MIIHIYAKVSTIKPATNHHPFGKTCHFANHPYLCKGL